ncbi:MAG: DUF2726 domain-containing protein [Deltaproteobacteria bacterium]|nr:DUF2726 domain-containing protein [Deltaproteobacteria bacterium]
MPNLIGPLFLIISILLFLAIVRGVINILTAGRRTPKSYPYEKQKSLFSPAERSFLGALEQAVGQNYRILGKVRLADVIRVKRGMSRSTWQSAFNQIQSKHLDFVACDPNDLTIQFVVELDDKSHAKAKRQNRDDFVDQALAAAGVPLFRFPAKQAYSVHDIRSRIFQTENDEMEANQPMKGIK